MANCTCKFNAELDRNHRPWCKIWPPHQRENKLMDEVNNQIDKKMGVAQKWAEALVEKLELKTKVELLEKERDMLGREADRLRRDYANLMAATRDCTCKKKT